MLKGEFSLRPTQVDPEYNIYEVLLPWAIQIREYVLGL